MLISWVWLGRIGQCRLRPSRWGQYHPRPSASPPGFGVILPPSLRTQTALADASSPDSQHYISYDLSLEWVSSYFQWSCFGMKKMKKLNVLWVKITNLAWNFLWLEHQLKLLTGKCFQLFSHAFNHFKLCLKLRLNQIEKWICEID